MDEWVKYYEDVFGMTEMIHFSDEDDLDRVLGADVEGRHRRQAAVVKFPINEPAEGKRKSQIDEYLEFYEGAGRPAHRRRHARHRRHRRPSCAAAASSS